MQNTIKERISELESYGLKSTVSETKSAYLYTSQHIEFVLEDTAAFAQMMQNYADSQIPTYVDAVFRGARIGVDIEYSNLFFSKAIVLEIYPMSLSEELSSELKNQKPKFYKYIKDFLEKKGLLYHIEYDTLSQDFSGFIKDIEEHYTLEDKSELFVTLEGLVYEGNGELIAPQRVWASLQKLDFKILNKEESVLVALSKFESASSYESKSTYLSSFEFEELKIEAKGTPQKADLLLENMKFNSSSNTQGESAELYAKSTFKELNLNAKEEHLTIKNFNLDTGISSLEKESFKELLELVSMVDKIEDIMLEKKIEYLFYKILSEGFIFNVADFSVEELEVQEGEALGGFKLQSQLELKKDKDFAQKLQISPLLLLSNIELETKLKLSKEIFEKLMEQGRGMSLPQEYMLEDEEGYLFNLQFRDGVSTLNGKPLE